MNQNYEQINIKVNIRELSTILAALRARQLETTNAFELDQLDLIASNDGEFDPLTAVEIDELCERLNI